MQKIQGQQKAKVVYPPGGRAKFNTYLYQKSAYIQCRLLLLDFISKFFKMPYDHHIDIGKKYFVFSVPVIFFNSISSSYPTPSSSSPSTHQDPLKSCQCPVGYLF
jgi:hypothetical protein